jgi:hypothetical protein
MYARQHYVLATSGKLGQKLSSKGTPKSGGKTSQDSGGSKPKSDGYGSQSHKGS